MKAQSVYLNEDVTVCVIGSFHSSEDSIVVFCVGTICWEGYSRTQKDERTMSP